MTLKSQENDFIVKMYKYSQTGNDILTKILPKNLDFVSKENSFGLILHRTLEKCLEQF